MHSICDMLMCLQIFCSSNNEEESMNDSSENEEDITWMINIYADEDDILDSRITLSDIIPGALLLVKLFSEKGKEFILVAVCQSSS